MDLRQISTFVAVAEELSITNAAKKCGMTKSGVSKAITAIEDELGVALMIRDTHGVQLTECGKMLYDYGRNMIKEAEGARDAINAINGKVSGVLRVGVGSFIEPYVRRAGCQMLKEYPDLRIEVIIEKDSVLNEMLRAHKVDVAFTIRSAHSTENIESEPIVPIQIRACVGATHRLAKKKKVTFEELTKQSIIMPEEDARSFDVIEKIINKDLRRLHTRVAINAADAAFSTAIEMGWVTFTTPAHVMGRSDLVTIPIEGLERKIWSNAHWMRDTYLKNSARRLLEILKDEVKPYYEALE